MKDQDRINLLAEKYCKVKKEGNDTDIRNSRNELWIAFFDSKEMKSKIANAAKKFGTTLLNAIQIYSFEDLWSEAMQVFSDKIEEYEFEKNDNFIAYIQEQFRYHISNKLGKETSTKGVKATETEDGKKKKERYIRNGGSLDETKKGSEDGTGTKKDDLRYTDDLDPETELELKEHIEQSRQKLVLLVVRFYETKKGRAANPSRLSYYKIFVTETVIVDIKENNSSDIYNQQEAMQAIDSGFVDFALKFKAPVSFEKLEDIVDVPIKHYCDILEGGEDKPLKLDHEAKPIIEYRFKVGLDDKRVSDAAITPHRKAFKEDMEALLK